jgi:hypothetical protein
MTRTFNLVLLAVLGFLDGITVAWFNMALDSPGCGEPCAGENLSSAMLWGFACFFAFPLVAHLVYRRTGANAISVVTLALGLSLITVLPAVGVYSYKLHRLYWRDGGPLGVPDIDFSYMIIATRPVGAMIPGTTERVLIQTWERCAFGLVSCDTNPKTFEAICMQNRTTALVEERDWAAFQRVPDEDLQGLLDYPRDMKLCAS